MKIYLQGMKNRMKYTSTDSSVTKTNFPSFSIAVPPPHHAQEGQHPDEEPQNEQEQDGAPLLPILLLLWDRRRLSSLFARKATTGRQQRFYLGRCSVAVVDLASDSLKYGGGGCHFCRRPRYCLRRRRLRRSHQAIPANELCRGGSGRGGSCRRVAAISRQPSF